MAPEGHHLLSITNPTSAENTHLILAGCLEHWPEGCCCTHLDICFLEGELDVAVPISIFICWKGSLMERSCEGWWALHTPGVTSPERAGELQGSALLSLGATTSIPEPVQHLFLQNAAKRSPALGECFDSSTTCKFCAVTSSQKIKARRQNVTWGLIHISGVSLSSFGAQQCFLLDFWVQTFNH